MTTITDFDAPFFDDQFGLVGCRLTNYRLVMEGKQLLTKEVTGKWTIYAPTFGKMREIIYNLVGENHYNLKELKPV